MKEKLLSKKVRNRRLLRSLKATILKLSMVKK